MNFFQIFLISVPVFVSLDLLWIGFVAYSFYQDRLGHLFGEVNWIAAGLFYIIFLIGLTFFVTAPAIAEGSWIKAATWGALFGLVTYATYDLTNQATIKDWPMIVTVVDMIWGAFLGGLVASITFFVSRFFV